MHAGEFSSMTSLNKRWLMYSLLQTCKSHLSKPPPETLDARTQTLDSLQTTVEVTRELGSRLAVLIIPRSLQLYAWELDRWLEAWP